MVAIEREGFPLGFDSIRIDFNDPGTPGNRIEVYEIEIPNH